MRAALLTTIVAVALLMASGCGTESAGGAAAQEIRDALGLVTADAPRAVTPCLAGPTGGGGAVALAAEFSGLEASRLVQVQGDLSTAELEQVPGRVREACVLGAAGPVALVSEQIIDGEPDSVFRVLLVDVTAATVRELAAWTAPRSGDLVGSRPGGLRHAVELVGATDDGSPVVDISLATVIADPDEGDESRTPQAAFRVAISPDSTSGSPRAEEIGRDAGGDGSHAPPADQVALFAFAAGGSDVRWRTIEHPTDPTRDAVLGSLPDGSSDATSATAGVLLRSGPTGSRTPEGSVTMLPAGVVPDSVTWAAGGDSLLVPVWSGRSTDPSASTSIHVLAPGTAAVPRIAVIEGAWEQVAPTGPGRLLLRRCGYNGDVLQCEYGAYDLERRALQLAPGAPEAGRFPVRLNELVPMPLLVGR